MAECSGYKDSGAAWIGKIPCVWDVHRLKIHLKRVEEKNPGNVQVLSLYRDLGIVPKDSRDDNRNVTSEDTSKYKYVQVGDFVVNKMKAWQGSVAVSDYEGIVSPAYYVYKFTDSGFHKRYFHYLLRSCYKEEFMRLSEGIRIGQWDLSSDDLDNVPILLPPTEEQRAIALYLDNTTKCIEELISEAKVSIEEYKSWKASIIYEAVTKGLNADVKMKDSGVEWIGAVPSDWHISKIRNFVSIRSGITLGKQYSAGMQLVSRPYLRVANVKAEYLDLNDVATIMVTKEEAEKYALSPGELLMTEGGDRDKLGRGTIWNGEIPGCLHQNHVFAVRVNEKFMLTEYLSYLTASPVGRVYFDLTAKKTTNLASTNSTTILQFSVPVPSLKEQQEIVEMLNQKCDSINKIIVEKQKLINDLEAYKKSLIFEVVTGKRQVV